jgi:hypothetical protein
MRRSSQFSGSAVVLSFAALLLLALPALCQEAQTGDAYFPHENFVQINPTLPNARLNFNDDSQESCCAKDSNSSSRFGQTDGQSTAASMSNGAARNNVAHSEFEKSNPRYLENATPSYLVTCDRFADMPELAASNSMPVADFNDFTPGNSLPIESYSTNVSMRQNVRYYTDPAMHVTSDFHIETAGGGSQIKLRDINSYSVCMGRGNNVAVIANSDGGSILAYNGNDHIYLAGNNTNMLTRTGAGEDTIELYQAQTRVSGADAATAGTTWTAYNIYKTALSGGSGTDTLVVKGSPLGTKWCHIGGYRIYGEYFYVVEFALPPSVTEGPRRQRISIGESVEYIVIKGKKYRLNEFLVHGQPMDTVARSIPIGDPLPRVAVGQ